jgi:two-component system sensor histidine kinase HydH
MFARKKHSDLPRIFSPWVVIGASLILFVIVTVLTVMNINRQRAATSTVLLEKGQALIKALEAGSRIGMRGRFAQGIRLSHLLEETAKLPGVDFIVVTDPQGDIIASNDFSRIGQRFVPGHGRADIVPSEHPQWFMDRGTDAASLFVVYSEFRPMRKERFRDHGQNLQQRFLTFCPAHPLPSDMQGGFAPPEKMFIYLGLMATSLEDAQRSDLIHSVAMSCIILCVGLAGFISLFWAQNLRVSQRLLSDSRAFASEVVANLPEGLVVMGPDGEVSFGNESALALCAPETTGTGNATQAHALVIPEEIRPVLDRLETERVVTEQEIACTFDKDRSIPLGVSGARIITEDGRFLGKILILRDLREVRRLQQEVKRKEKLAAIGSLAAGVAHEIRNPLSSIKGFATLFRTRFAPDSTEHGAAEIMIHEVDRLNRVVTELIEYARPSHVAARKTDFRDMIAHSLSLIKQDVQQAGVHVETDIPDDVEEVFLDPDRMQQCLLNIYLNAVQAMPRGGTLRVEGFRHPDGRLGMRISDTGKGIPAQDLSKIFDPYYTTKNRGTGLGLAMVLKIVEAHHGEITVDSKEGQGTMITILLPQAENSQQDPA